MCYHKQQLWTAFLASCLSSACLQHHQTQMELSSCNIELMNSSTRKKYVYTSQNSQPSNDGQGQAIPSTLTNCWYNVNHDHINDKSVLKVQPCAVLFPASWASSSCTCTYTCTYGIGYYHSEVYQRSCGNNIRAYMYLRTCTRICMYMHAIRYPYNLCIQYMYCTDFTRSRTCGVDAPTTTGYHSFFLGKRNTKTNMHVYMSVLRSCARGDFIHNI